jgi:TonB family protein
MGKIVKYCAACEEGFAAKFAFCPNCGGALTAYELNPLADQANVNQPPENANFEAETAVPPTSEASLTENHPVEPETVAFASETEEEKVFDDEYLPEETAAANNVLRADDFSESPYHAFQSSNYQPAADDASDYHITVIEEKNSSIRNALLLGSCMLVITVALAGVVYSLFNKEIYAAGLENTELINAMVVDETPMEIEEDKPEQKKDKDAGGGGGGGRDELDETSKGRLAPQTKNPQIRPDVSIEQKDFDLKYQAFTQGPERPVKVTDERYGDPNSQSYKLSNGTGTGGGQGSGVGSGQGSGRGTGQGSGIGSGIGSGSGDGIGGGKGSGESDNEPPKPKAPVPVGPTEGVKIISKPRANYTDAARTNNIQGVVRVRVTFLANGTIGGISPVSNLGYGLTEQALAAARSIRFEPAKKGGVPYSVTKVVEYTFTLY